MLLKKWLIGDTDNDDRINFKEFRILCKHLNVKIKKHILHCEFNVMQAAYLLTFIDI
jgi:hypothetical protein